MSVRKLTGPPDREDESCSEQEIGTAYWDDMWNAGAEQEDEEDADE